MEKKKIDYRSIKSIEDLEKARRLESLIWSEYEATPVHQTLTVIKNGGMVLGAFFEDELIGFQYSFPGFNKGESYLCSHSLAIHPDFRKLGIGEKLKLIQREESIKKGYDLVTWTYDPLETVNGYLNLHKLGARCSTYVENCYGEMQDDLNQGIPSDRFRVEWHIKESADERGSVSEELLKSDSLVIKIEKNSAGYLVPAEIDLMMDSESGLLFVPVPSDFQNLKAKNLELAVSWRMNTRQAFTHYFAKSWTAIDIIRSRSNPELCYYVLKRGCLARQQSGSALV
ncbi:GNAT family N-acetyltransferase [Brevibacillus reuszeri]|uniref:GNAT family N-acetyltransferase n=1 Tax=Brevibacillus reuszeri TaxID=54915 RepID=UPI003D1960C8